MSKKLCTTHATMTAASTQKLRKTQRHHPWEPLFSSKGSHPLPVLSEEEARTACAWGERRLSTSSYLFMGLP